MSEEQVIEEVDELVQIADLGLFCNLDIGRYVYIECGQPATSLAIDRGAPRISLKRPRCAAHPAEFRDDRVGAAVYEIHRPLMK